ncbi:hypothetical protein LJR220_000879 [Bradyrhizobium sp. LjRoot220]
MAGSIGFAGGGSCLSTFAPNMRGTICGVADSSTQAFFDAFVG